MDTAQLKAADFFEQLIERVLAKTRDRDAADRYPEGPWLLKIADAAERLNCTPQQVRTLISRGVLPFVQLHDRGDKYIDVRDLDRVIQSHKSNAA